MNLVNIPKDIQIKYVKRIRRTTIRIKPDGEVRVTAPYGVPQNEVYKFIQKKSDWIQSKLDQFKRASTGQKYEFTQGSQIPFLGRLIQINLTEGPESIFFDTEKINISLDIEKMKNTEYIKMKLIKWYQDQAFLKIKDRVMDYSALLGLVPKTISIKNYKSRWGACTSKKDLIFNWQIIIMKENHFNYVVAHEVCHLKEMNHSLRFYKILSQLGFEKNSIHSEMRYLKNLF